MQVKILFKKSLFPIPSYMNPDEVKIKFEYDESSPEDVVYNEGEFEPFPVPENGKFRIWNKESNEERNKDPVPDGGDYLPPNKEITFSDLNGSATSKTVYLEGINVGQDIIKCSIVEDSNCFDDVYVNVFDLEFHSFVRTGHDDEIQDLPSHITESHFQPELYMGISNVSINGNNLTFTAFGKLIDYYSEVTSSGQISSIEVLSNNNSIGSMTVSYSGSNSIWQKRTISSVQSRSFSIPFNGSSPHIKFKAQSAAGLLGYHVIGIPISPVYAENNEDDYVVSANVDFDSGGNITSISSQGSLGNLTFASIGSNQFTSPTPNNEFIDSALLEVESVNDNRIKVRIDNIYNGNIVESSGYYLLVNEDNSYEAIEIVEEEYVQLFNDISLNVTNNGNEISDIEFLYQGNSYSATLQDGKYLFNINSGILSTVEIDLLFSNFEGGSKVVYTNTSFGGIGNYSIPLSSTGSGNGFQFGSSSNASKYQDEYEVGEPATVLQSGKSYLSQLVIGYTYEGKEFTDEQKPFEIKIDDENTEVYKDENGTYDELTGGN